VMARKQQPQAPVQDDTQGGATSQPPEESLPDTPQPAIDILTEDALPNLCVRLLEHARALPEIGPDAVVAQAAYEPGTIEAFKDDDRRTMRVVYDATTHQPSKQEFAN